MDQNNIVSIVIWGVIISAAVWVYKDAQKYERSGVKVVPVPLMWAFMVIALGIFALPIYLFKRRSYREQATRPVNSGVK